jgi:predicted hotdog family 3-hydroxylacyl-ACP dehydratase
MSEPERRTAADLPAPAADLVPHRPPVRLIEHLLEVHAAAGRASATVRADSLHVNADGTLDPTAHLELMGQTFAAAKSWRDRQQGRPPRVGFLAGATGMDCLDTARIGDQLTIAIKQTGTFGAFAMLEGHVHRHARRIAGGRLKLWLHPSHHAPSGTTKKMPSKPSQPLTSLQNAIQAAADRALKREGDHGLVQSFCFPPEFIAFRGHFPGNPLLPAFVQIRMAQVMLESAAQAPLQLERIDNAKFREPLPPGQSVRVHCDLERTPNNHKAAVALMVLDRRIATFHLTFRLAEPASA